MSPFGTTTQRSGSIYSAEFFSGWQINDFSHRFLSVAPVRDVPSPSASLRLGAAHQSLALASAPEVAISLPSRARAQVDAERCKASFELAQEHEKKQQLAEAENRGSSGGRQLPVRRELEGAYRAIV